MKTKHPIHIMVFEVVTSDGDIMPPFIFPHGLHQVPGESSAALDQEGGCWKTLHLAKELCHATQRKTQYWLSENFCYITPNNPLDYYMGHSWARYQHNSMQHQKWTESKDNNSNIYQFKQEDNQKVWQEIPKSSGGCGWSKWWFIWINLIYSISRVRCQYYFHFWII